ncbi:hypothetical protein [Nannocystis pusilla]|uniref:Uncharacterized protein n=1 Tax=Nannocystis pusilla TaxID=889268 RepID=A0ABS7U5X3_9BACT|nr:hypothetical protein [Nannocystis pusilla]MBZ5715809.1 hypothetical protein [Nannocystis pusilla]
MQTGRGGAAPSVRVGASWRSRSPRCAGPGGFAGDDVHFHARGHEAVALADGYESGQASRCG